MVEALEISYRAGGTRILDGVTARFRGNAFNVILGPNGAGKSTLLKIASGLLHPTSGEVRYDGRAIGNYDPEALAKMRGVLSQHVELAFPLPVEDVVLMGRYPHYGRAPSAHDRAIVAETLALVGMHEKRAQPYPTLSGGEQQKVQLARVLSQIWNDAEPRGPVCLFLDEPTSSLDIHYQLALLEIVRAFRERRCTIIAILHDLNVASRYGDAFFLLERGRLALETDSADAIPLDLIERVFQVRAERVPGTGTAAATWQFRL